MKLELGDVIKAVIESQVAHPWVHQIHYISCAPTISCTSPVYGWCHIAFDQDSEHVQALVDKLKDTCKAIFGRPITVYVYIRKEET